MASRTSTKTAPKNPTEGSLFPEVAVRPAASSKSAKKKTSKAAKPTSSKSSSSSPSSAPRPLAKPAALKSSMVSSSSASGIRLAPEPTPEAAAPSRTGKLVALGLAAAVLIGAGVFGAIQFFGSDESSQLTNRAFSKTAATVADSVKLHPTDGAQPATDASEASSEAVAVTSASPTELKSTSGAHSPLATALDKLVAATRRGDEAATLAAKSALAQLVSENPTAALAAAMTALKGETDLQSLAVLSTVFLMDGLAGRPEVLAALADMARQDDLPARRATAVRTLGNLPGGDGARVDLLAGFEKTDSDSSVREAAAIALGVVADRSPGEVAAAAATSLVDAVANESDPRVRSMLLYGVRDTRAANVTDVLLNALAHDPDPAPRLAAADMLADVAAAYRPRVLDALAAQFECENDPNMDATIVKSIVSAGRLAAIPVLQRIRGSSVGGLQTTIDDYLAGLTSGEDNLDKLEAIKLAREAARAR